jgi:hypothetical protein
MNRRIKPVVVAEKPAPPKRYQKPKRRASGWAGI